MPVKRTVTAALLSALVLYLAVMIIDIAINQDAHRARMVHVLH